MADYLSFDEEKVKKLKQLQKSLTGNSITGSGSSSLLYLKFLK